MVEKLKKTGIDTERKRAEEELLSSEARYRSLVESSPDGVIVHRNGKFLYANSVALKLYGAETLEQLQAKTVLELIHTDERAVIESRMRQGLAGQRLPLQETRMLSLDGRVIYVESVGGMIDFQGEPAVQIMIRDITGGKRREEELSRLNRTLRALSNSNQAMMHATDESEYLQEVCRVVVEDCGHAMVWIGYAEEDEGKTVRPVAHAGFDEGYLERLNITWADTERGRGPTGTAIRTGKVSTCRNMLTDPLFKPWREEARKRGYASSIVLPLMEGSKAFGAITIYSREPDPFSEDEVKLLTELASDLAYGITAIRLRVAHAKAEEALRMARDELELRVQERTGQLVKAIQALEAEITERMRTENILTEKTRELETFFKHSSACMVFLDRDFNFIRVNDAYAKVWHRDVSEFPGHNHFEYYPSDELKEKFERVVETKEPYNVFARPFVFPDHPEWGVSYWDLSLYPVFDDVGEITFLVYVLNDVTERKRSEEAIQQSSAEIHDLYNSAPCGYHSLDKDGFFVRINDTELKWLGYTREEIVRKIKFLDILTHKSLQTFMDSFPRFKEQGWINNLEFEMIRKDGTIMPVLLNATAVKDNEGNYVLSRSTLFDITERKQLDEEIRKAARDWQVTFDSIKDHVMILDEDFKIYRVNAAAASFFNLPPDKITNNHCFSLMHNTDGPVDGCPLAKTLKTKRHEEVEHHDETRDMWFLASVDPVVNDKGEIIRVIHTVKDITERKRAEEEKSRLETQLIQAQKIEALGKLAGGIAHDFNNVLQPILINSELILDTLLKGTQEREYLDQIIDAAQLGKNLVKQIKMFGATKGSLSKPIAVGPVVKDALAFFMRSLPPAVKFKQSITTQKSLVQAEPTQIYQLILNLCTNAVQAMKSDKGSLSVALKETKITKSAQAFVNDLTPGKYVKLTVRDTGYGISPEIKDKIFDPFFTTRKSGKGTGLGLAVVHEVVKNAGGSILLHSEVGKGATFEIFFPLYLDSGNQTLISNPNMNGHNEKHILLVDDNTAELRSIHQLLVHIGYRVTATTDPQEALSLFKSDPDKFSLLITDQVMPRMKGHELATRVHEVRKDFPVIVCSGCEEALQELQEQRTDIHEYMLKPFSRSELADAILRIMS